MRLIKIGSRLRGRDPTPCGEGARTLLIASIGTSHPADSIDEELAKCAAAFEAGAHVVADHSFYGDIPLLHKRIVREWDLCLSTVACYEFAARHRSFEWKGLDQRVFVELLEEQIERGIDMVTVHASLTAEDGERIRVNSRLIPTTSKGGGILARYMRRTGRENPYLEHFDDVLDVLARTGVTLSLGTTFRAGSVCDPWDDLMAGELRRMGELVDRSIARGVPVMVEGFGHAPLDAIPTYVRLAKAFCAGVPYRVLTVPTDRALGLDHIASSAAAAAAVAAGADAVTAISRAEHIGLPRTADTAEGVRAASVAAAAGELVKLADYGQERQMSTARWDSGCKGEVAAAINPAYAAGALADHGRLDDPRVQCGMCGKFCGIKAGNLTMRHSGPGVDDAT